MANENSAAGRRSAADRDRSYGGGYNSAGRSIGSDRPDRNALNLDFVTPKYGWGDANLSDFSIIGGGLRGLFDTIASGNTYAGRTPTGFVGGKASDGGPKAMSQQGIDPGVPGMYQNLARRMLKLDQPMTSQAPSAPMAPAPTLPGPMQMGAQWLGVPGGSGYGVQIPSYSFFPGVK